MLIADWKCLPPTGHRLFERRDDRGVVAGAELARDGAGDGAAAERLAGENVVDAPADVLAEAFRIARGATRVKGFAVGRTIFADPARAWMAGKIDDAMATQQMAERFASLVEAWEKAS